MKNIAKKNNADPRLAPAQAIVDAAMEKARERGESARMVTTVGESTRQLVAERIKTGSDLETAPGPPPSPGIPQPQRGKDRSR